MTPTANGRPATCEIPGCSRRMHGAGLCRTHYDEQRYLASTGRDPAAAAAAERELSIRAELEYGAVGTTRSATGTMFDDDRQRRAAWEERRDELMAAYLTEPVAPGRRPWAWWVYDAGRDPHVVEYPGPSWRADDADAYADELDRYKNEPTEFLAAHGHLTDREIAVIERDADEARPRIGTPAERIGSGGIDRADQRRVALWEAVERALQAA